MGFTLQAHLPMTGSWDSAMYHCADGLFRQGFEPQGLIGLHEPLISFHQTMANLGLQGAFLLNHLGKLR